MIVQSCEQCRPLSQHCVSDPEPLVQVTHRNSPFLSLLQCNSGQVPDDDSLARLLQAAFTQQSKEPSDIDPGHVKEEQEYVDVEVESEEWWTECKEEEADEEAEWWEWSDQHPPPPPPPPPPPSTSPSEPVDPCDDRHQDKSELAGQATHGYWHARYQSGKGTSDVCHVRQEWGGQRWYGYKGMNKGKYKTKSKHKPFWAFQHRMGKAANKGKVDDYGGVYTSDGYKDPDGNEWERLRFALGT